MEEGVGFRPTKDTVNALASFQNWCIQSLYQPSKIILGILIQIPNDNHQQFYVYDDNNVKLTHVLYQSFFQLLWQYQIFDLIQYILQL